jgi:serine/threonine protein kinase
VELRAGDEFAGYRIEEVAGRGGMGVVFRARNLITNQQRALKVINPELSNDVQFRARFKRESRVAAELEHPNIIPLYEAREEDGHLYLVMRYVEGTDLGELLRQEGALEPNRAVEIVDQVATALDTAHNRGLVHRDVKPANVLLASSGSEEHAYLTDFGLVKDAAAATLLTEPNTFLGTYHYAAPEQINPSGRPLDARADIYALGCVLCHALTGQVPFPRNDVKAIIAGHLFFDPPRLTERRPDLGEAIDAVIDRAMAKDPDDRFATAGDLARAAREAMVAPAVVAEPDEETVVPPGEPTVVPPSEPTVDLPAEPTVVPHAEPTVVPPKTRARRRGVVAGAVVGGAAILAALLLVFADGGSEDGKQTEAGDTGRAAEVPTPAEPELTGEQRLLRHIPADLRDQCQSTASERPDYEVTGQLTYYTCRSADGAFSYSYSLLASADELESFYSLARDELNSRTDGDTKAARCQDVTENSVFVGTWKYPGESRPAGLYVCGAGEGFSRGSVRGEVNSIARSTNIGLTVQAQTPNGDPARTYRAWRQALPLP